MVQVKLTTMPTMATLKTQFENLEKNYVNVEKKVKNFIKTVVFKGFIDCRVSRVSEYYIWSDPYRFKNVMSGSIKKFIKRSEYPEFFDFMCKEIKTKKSLNEFDGKRFTKYVRDILEDNYTGFDKEPDIVLDVRTYANEKGVEILIDFTISYSNY